MSSDSKGKKCIAPKFSLVSKRCLVLLGHMKERWDLFYFTSKVKPQGVYSTGQHFDEVNYGTVSIPFVCCCLWCSNAKPSSWSLGLSPFLCLKCTWKPRKEVIQKSFLIAAFQLQPTEYLMFQSYFPAHHWCLSHCCNPPLHPHVCTDQ